VRFDHGQPRQSSFHYLNRRKLSKIAVRSHTRPATRTNTVTPLTIAFAPFPRLTTEAPGARPQLVRKEPWTDRLSILDWTENDASCQDESIMSTGNGRIVEAKRSYG